MKIPYQIRIDEDLLDKVKKSAKDNERSVNAEIRWLIKVALSNKQLHITDLYKVSSVFKQRTKVNNKQY